MLEIFDLLSRTPSSNAKKDILAENENTPLFKDVLFRALDPHVRYYIRKVPEFSFNGENKPLSWALTNLDMIADRKLTGHAAIDFLADTLSSLSKDDAEVVLKIIAKDLRCGVSTGLVNKVFDNLISEFDVALCATLDEKAKAKYIPKRFTVEPKYDGMRVLAFVEGGEVLFYSRAGKPIETLDHIANEILVLANGEDFVFDTEAVSGTFQNTMSAVKRLGKNKTELAKLIVFDVIRLSEFNASSCPDTQEVRTNRLVEGFTRFEDGPEFMIRSIAEEYVPNSEETAVDFIMRKYAEFRVTYEGAIVKDLDGKNTFKRSRAWMKVKPCETIDVEITGFMEGTKKNVGKLGAFTYDYEGKPCRVGGGFSDKQREDFWKRRFEMVGTMIEIEIMEPTETGSTRHAVFIRERDFKGEKG